MGMKYFYDVYYGQQGDLHGLQEESGDEMRVKNSHCACSEEGEGEGSGGGFR